MQKKEYERAKLYNGRFLDCDSKHMKGRYRAIQLEFLTGNQTEAIKMLDAEIKSEDSKSFEPLLKWIADQTSLQNQEDLIVKKTVQQLTMTTSEDDSKVIASLPVPLRVKVFSLLSLEVQ